MTVLLFIIFSWVIDSLTDIPSFNARSFSSAFFNPTPDQLNHRVLFILILIIFGSYSYYLIRKLRYTQISLQESQEIVTNAFHKTPLGMCVVSLNLEYIALNQAYCDILGYTKEELHTITFRDFTHPDDQEIDTPFIKDLMENKIESFMSVKRYIHKKGHTIWGQATVRLIRDEENKPRYFVTQIQDITALKTAENKLQLLAKTDYLTGCLNRRAFLERLEAEIDRSRRENTVISLILSDLDHFKAINDTYGHLAGDYVLQQFTKCLLDNCRSYDFLGRYGGEEFIICLPNTNAEAARTIAERMRNSVAALNLDYGDSKNINLTSSFGVATLTEKEIKNIKKMDTIISEADKALYQAKEQRNCVCIV